MRDDSRDTCHRQSNWRQTTSGSTPAGGGTPLRCSRAAFAVTPVLFFLLTVFLVFNGPHVFALNGSEASQQASPAVPANEASTEAPTATAPGINNGGTDTRTATEEVVRTTTLDPMAAVLATEDPMVIRMQNVTSEYPRFQGRIRNEFILPYTSEIDNFIRTQCDIVRKAIMTKWLPQARRDVDGVFRLHMGFVGESHARVMRRDVIEDIQVCLAGKFRERSVHCEVPFSMLCKSAVFEPELTGLEDPPIQPGTQLVLSIHQVSFAKNLVQTLANAYLPLFQNASEEKRRGDYAALFQPSISLNLKPVARNTDTKKKKEALPTAWMSPVFNLRAPDILYLNTGSWDTVHAEKVWSDYDIYSHDVYKRSDLDTFLLRTAEQLEMSLRANYSLPMQALLRVLSDASEEDRFKSGEIHPETQAFMPPRKVVLSTPPVLNCSGWFHYVVGKRPRKQVRFDYRYYLRGVQRCSRIVYPLQEAARKVLFDVLESVRREREGADARRGEEGAGRSGKPLEEVLLTWSAPDNPCHRSDSIHLDHHTPVCRKYIMDYFYSHV